MFLLGSRALYGIVNADRNDDWDILLSENEMLFSLKCTLHYVNGIEYQGQHGLAKINAIVVAENKECIMNQVYRKLSLLELKTISAEIGLLKILPYDIYKALLVAIPEPLRTEDQKHYINFMHQTKENQQIMEQLKQSYYQLDTKNYFFDGYKKRRYVPHDRIHWWVSQALGLCTPTYLSIMISPVDISEELFYQLSLDKQYTLFFEEAMVLAIERYLIRNSAETDIHLTALWRDFFELDSAGNPVMQRLIELCTVGEIADHPAWLATWGEHHFFDMNSSFREFMTTCMKYLPQSLFDYMRYLRTNLNKAST